ncbi:hypothetical protein CEXT_735281 [Caerostris extrusa]|uniref:Uncharacterized protein n=1 Tax=Caerostris extrusa TaxID=172846 RepID=A0AAV4T496_CAEEX|nr:hypothetical protein CEXT_735281 [Caerostris extrusa]
MQCSQQNNSSKFGVNFPPLKTRIPLITSQTVFQLNGCFCHQVLFLSKDIRARPGYTSHCPSVRFIRLTGEGSLLN